MCRQFSFRPAITFRSGLVTSPQLYPRPIEYYLIPRALLLMVRVPALLSPSVAGLGLLTNSLPKAGNWYHMLSIFSSVSESPLRLLSNKLLWISELLFLLPQMNLNYNFLGVSRWLQARVKFNEREAAEFMLWIAKSFKIHEQGRKLWRNSIARTICFVGGSFIPSTALSFLLRIFFFFISPALTFFQSDKCQRLCGKQWKRWSE